MSDLFDEFEFKPLTEGLGFHKKADQPASSPQPIPLSIQLSSTASSDIFSQPLDPVKESEESLSLSEEIGGDLLPRESSSETSKSISDLIASLPPSLDFLDEKPVEEPSVADDKPQIFQPLAREEYKPTPKVTSTPTIGGTLAGPQPLPPPGTKVTATSAAATTGASSFRSQLDEGLARSFPHLERRKEIRKSTDTVSSIEPIACHFGAAILDAMVVTGIGTILLVCILLITKVNLVGLLNNAQTYGPTRVHLGLLFLSVLQLYMLTARSFTGASLGEWAFDLQMGTDDDRKRILYPLQVLWRTVLITVTGIVVLPLLSYFFGRDLVKYLTGLQLYRRP